MTMGFRRNARSQTARRTENRSPRKRGSPVCFEEWSCLAPAGDCGSRFITDCAGVHSAAALDLPERVLNLIGWADRRACSHFIFLVYPRHAPSLVRLLEQDVHHGPGHVDQNKKPGRCRDNGRDNPTDHEQFARLRLRGHDHFV
jgi:hypothetical protein